MPLDNEFNMPFGSKNRTSTRYRTKDTTETSGHTTRPQKRNNPSQSDAAKQADAKRSYERYMTLARNALATGDSVEIENFYQHAEHYFRKMNLQAA